MNSDHRNLNKRKIASFPVSDDILPAAHSELLRLLRRLMKSYQDNPVPGTVHYKDIGAVTVQYSISSFEASTWRD